MQTTAQSADRPRQDSWTASVTAFASVVVGTYVVAFGWWALRESGSYPRWVYPYSWTHLWYAWNEHPFGYLALAGLLQPALLIPACLAVRARRPRVGRGMLVGLIVTFVLALLLTALLAYAALAAAAYSV